MHTHPSHKAATLLSCIDLAVALPAFMCSLKALADLFALDRIYNEIIFRWALQACFGWLPWHAAFLALTQNSVHHCIADTTRLVVPASARTCRCRLPPGRNDDYIAPEKVKRRMGSSTSATCTA